MEFALQGAGSYETLLGAAHWAEDRGLVCFAVPDIRAAIADLVAKGAAMIDREPRIGAAGLPIAFIQPASTGGILVELVERK